MSCAKIQSNNQPINPFCYMNAAEIIILLFLAAVVLTSSISAEGGSVGRRVLASRHSESSSKSTESSEIYDDPDNGDENMKIKHKKILEFTDEHNLSWSIKLRRDSLYVELPQQLCEGSKEKFINLLEFADDTLKCKNVIVYFDKTRSDRASLVRTFMFLGFHILSPDNTLMLANDKNPDQLFMIYINDNDE
ncbi:unnamed protein product [Adineta steineri]|uniref:Ornithine decarboxylase antizyme n=1 Tax=Adineta steineri TaxID=433720 RepID=A0A815D8A9_9BILA|nr:unnamed protein product [Adineta steineri]